MRDYTTDSPVFSDRITITETTDTDHADNINHAPVEVFQNTLVLAEALDADLIDRAFNETFTNAGGGENA